MAPNAAAALQNVSLVGQNKTAVVVGGFLGIGAAVARLLAKLGCSRIIIMGRNETRGKAVLEALKKLAPEGSRIEVELVMGDVS
jgi:NAD(P)-dependent dehydrogenase (short-subunit alcohol dehydrogenase family)